MSENKHQTDFAIKAQHLAKRWFSRSLEALSIAERRVVERSADRKTIAANQHEAAQSTDTVGAKVADKVASFGGSWTFILLFIAFLVCWAGVNIWMSQQALDPYPFIFLNLMLSMLAALQAPIIMMSQNRQSARDRRSAEHDYEVNLKAEIEIMALHDKLDQMRNDQLNHILEKQQQQIEILERMVKDLQQKD